MDVTKKLVKSVNGYYTRMLRTALNVHWQHHMNESFPKVSETIRARQERIKVQRRHPPYTPYSIGDSSRVIFRIGIKLPRDELPMEWGVYGGCLLCPPYPLLVQDD